MKRHPQAGDGVSGPGLGSIGFCSFKCWLKLALRPLFLLCLLGGAFYFGELALAATSAPKNAVQIKKKAVHGKAWAFGQSEDRKAALWRRGVPVQSLSKRAVTGVNLQGAKASGEEKKVSGKALVSKAAKGKGVMNTGGGINRAVATARSGPSAAGNTLPSPGKSAKPKGAVGVSMQDSTSTWNVTPMRESMRPDEVKARDRHHVLRAFAGVSSGDNLSISVGPELTLKDEQNCAESAGASQPDSALGLGMQFKLDF